MARWNHAFAFFALAHILQRYGPVPWGRREINNKPFSVSDRQYPQDENLFCNLLQVPFAPSMSFCLFACPSLPSGVRCSRLVLRCSTLFFTARTSLCYLFDLLPRTMVGRDCSFPEPCSRLQSSFS